MARLSRLYNFACTEVRKLPFREAIFVIVAKDVSRFDISMQYTYEMQIFYAHAQLKSAFQMAVLIYRKSFEVNFFRLTS